MAPESPITFKSRFYSIPKNPHDTLPQREEFSRWLANREASIQQFMGGLSLSKREQWDFSPASLDVLGEWLLEKFEDSKALLAPESSAVLDGAMSYIGEVYIRHMEGSGWDMHLWHPKIMYYGEPVIHGPLYNCFFNSPRSMIIVAVERREANSIRRLFDNNLAHTPPIYRGKRHGNIFNTPTEWKAWLQDMQPALDYYFSLLPSEVVSKLDYSVASLDVLEEWILSQYPEQLFGISHQFPEITDGASRYIGETFIRNLDAKWDIILDNPLSPYFGWPIVKGLHQHRFKYSPSQMLFFRVTGDRKGNYLSKTLTKEMTKSK